MQQRRLADTQFSPFSFPAAVSFILPHDSTILCQFATLATRRKKKMVDNADWNKTVRVNDRVLLCSNGEL